MIFENNSVKEEMLCLMLVKETTWDEYIYQVFKSYILGLKLTL